MTTVIANSLDNPIEDVQNRLDTRHIVIQKVGIKSIKHPILFRDLQNREQHTIATFDMSVRLDEHLKGTHMSRFIELIHEHAHTIQNDSLSLLLKKMLAKLNAQQGYIDISFPYFRSKKAPVSQTLSTLDYQVTLHGEIHDHLIATSYTVVVPVTSLCPCSKEISAYGAHNQRSHITLKVATQQSICLDALIGLVEAQGSCELYATLKRSDEKYITEKAYENPKFVEDIVRDVALEMKKDPRILSFSVEAENFESIHNHSAYARVVSE